jgi:cysteine desulfurase
VVQSNAVTIYLDHAATTPLLPAVREAWVEALGLVGNPSSIHGDGQNARRMLEESREAIAASLGCDAIEVVLTSGGTESVNLGIKGLFWAAIAADPRRRRILVPCGEHHATIDTVEWLERQEGAVIEWLPIDELGRVRRAAVEAALAEHDDVALLTMLWANNEVGTIQPVVELAAVAAGHGVPVHADAVGAWRHVPLDFASSGLAALSVSAHKIGGPLGMGALVVSRTADLVPLVHGGGQQRRLRSGTQDAPAARAFAVAAQHPIADTSALRDRLIAGVRAAVPSAILRGDPVDRLEGNAHFTFPGCEGDSLLLLLDAAGISVSTGSACQAGVAEPSHVLIGMGLSEEEARGALRFTLGSTSTDADVDALLAALPAAHEGASRAGLAGRDIGLTV